MDKDLYDIMQKLMKENGSENTADVMYLGTISMEENTSNGPVKISKDVIAMFDIAPDGNVIIKYYDENQNLIAGRGFDGELFPSEAYRNSDLGFLSEIDSLDESQGISLNELDEELDKVAKILGISKSDIRSMSKSDLDTVVKSKDDSAIDLSGEDSKGLSKDEKAKQDEATLDNIDSKQEIDLSKKIDDKLTLADVLGVPAGSKLIVAYSDKIKGNTNTTRFSCIIQNSDGTLESADMLNQVGGKESSKNVYETNRDGSRVDNKVVQSSYAINSPLVKDSIITIRIGQMGTIEVGYGQMDKTSHNDAITQRLETSEIYPVRSHVRNEFSKSKGTDNIPNKMDEIREHEKHGCNDLTLAEADGNPNTGHNHDEDVVERILSDEDVGNIIDEVFTSDEIKERFDDICEKNPDNDYDTNLELTKNELASDAEHLHTR